MKNRLISRFILRSLIGLALLLPTRSFAQADEKDEREQEVRIKIEKDDGSGQIAIDTTSEINSDTDIEMLLRSLGIDPSLGQVENNERIEITIRKYDEG